MAAPLAISLGDPAGIGPELVCEAWVRREADGQPPFFVVGGAQLLAEAACMRGLDCPVTRVSMPDEASACFLEALPVLGDLDADYAPGQASREGARLALASLERATELAISGEASAIVTGPVAKAALADVGFTHPGQTEFVAGACNVAPQDAVMLLAGPQLRTVPMTVHCALADVPGRLSIELIVRRSRIVAQAMRMDFGLEHPRLALTGLNPHAGEDGSMGGEEIAIIAPAIAQLRADGINATGPHPADSLFAPHARPTYDVAIAMYHDQALVPIKALDFDAGVNMTVGLPIVRTSPDHGTAFSIAGKRQASPGAMIAAIRMAGKCAARRAAFSLRLS